jgi:hypothetical protein
LKSQNRLRRFADRPTNSNYELVAEFGIFFLGAVKPVNIGRLAEFRHLLYPPDQMLVRRRYRYSADKHDGDLS